MLPLSRGPCVENALYCTFNLNIEMTGILELEGLSFQVQLLSLDWPKMMVSDWIFQPLIVVDSSKLLLRFCARAAIHRAERAAALVGWWAWSWLRLRNQWTKRTRQEGRTRTQLKPKVPQKHPLGKPNFYASVWEQLLQAFSNSPSPFFQLSYCKSVILILMVKVTKFFNIMNLLSKDFKLSKLKTLFIN